MPRTLDSEPTRFHADAFTTRASADALISACRLLAASQEEDAREALAAMPTMPAPANDAEEAEADPEFSAAGFREECAWAKGDDDGDR